MHLFVHVAKTVISVSVGDGQQPVKWIADVGMARYDENQGRGLGVPTGVRLEDGSLLGLTQSIADAGLKDGSHVWCVFRSFTASEKGKKPTGGAAAATFDEDDD